MRRTASLATLVILIATVLWACSPEPAPSPSEEATPAQARPEGVSTPAPEEAAVTTAPAAVEPQISSAPAIPGPDLAPDEPQSWPLLEEFRVLTAQTIAVVESGDTDQMMPALASYGPMATDLASGSPTQQPRNPSEMQSLQEELARLVAPFEKGDAAPDEMLDILRQIEPILDQLSEAAGIE